MSGSTVNGVTRYKWEQDISEKYFTPFQDSKTARLMKLTGAFGGSASIPVKEDTK